MGGLPNGNGPLLESIAAECLDNGEPDLTVLVVGKESGVPSRFQGGALDAEDPDRVRAWRQTVDQVRAYTWPDAPSAAALPVEEVLRGLKIPGLPHGVTPRELLAVVKYQDEAADEGWLVRVTSDLDDDEVLGVLVGYVEHLTQQAAASWDEGDPTRPSG